MTERETDFEFDFFEEPETREAAPSDRAPRISGSGKPPRAPRADITPLLRLVVAVAVAILVVVLLVFWVKSCSGDSKQTTYERYMERVRLVAVQSDRLGKQLATILATPGLKASDLDPKLRGLAQQELQQIGSANEIRPPGTMRLAQQHVVEALRLRASGLQGLAEVFAAAAATKQANTVAQSLADQGARLVASDVVWADLFRATALAQLRKENLTGVTVPASRFLSSTDLAAAASWTPVLRRLTGIAGSVGDNLAHGTGLVSVVALPRGQRLVPAPSENTVVASTDLAFEVTVQDTGDAQEVQVPVTLTIQQSPKSITKKQYIAQVNPGDEKKVVFRNIGPVQFAARTTVRVEVQPVLGEKNTSNNSAEYPVIFSLPGG